MSDAEQSQSRLMDEAIDLVIRLQNDPDNPISVEMVRAWRARGPEHEQVWARVAKVHGASGKVLADRHAAERRGRPDVSRRNLMIGVGVAALGALGGGYLALPELVVMARADFTTGKGEIRRIALADGSTATLGPDSALTVDFAGAYRRIELLAGMSFFEVAPDAARPFIVASGQLTATALGTAYGVSSDAGFVTVAVEHGMVETRAPDSALSSGTRLEAGDWVTLDPSSHEVERGTKEAGQAASWRENYIVAERETVSALVARIGRWLPGRIVMADPFIGAQRVSGIFDLNDPRLALEAVVHPAGARVRQVSSILTIISPI